MIMNCFYNALSGIDGRPDLDLFLFDAVSTRFQELHVEGLALVAAFFFKSSSRTSKGEATQQPNTMVLKQILGPAAGTA